MRGSISKTLIALFPSPPLLPGLEYRDSVPDEGLVRALLGAMPDRLAHVLGVAATARELGQQLQYGEEFERSLQTAALFHDIGYSSSLQRTGFHPIDGAVFLAHCHVSDEIVQAVLFHSGAAREAAGVLEWNEVYRRLESAAVESDLQDALTIADLRTSPTGNRITMLERVLDIERRYGPDLRVSRAARDGIPVAAATRDRVLRRIAACAPQVLPWLFMDIDGTLITPGSRITPGNSSALRQYLERGGHITLATGKHPRAIEDLVQQVGLGGPHIACNGAALVTGGVAVQLASLGARGEEAAKRLLAERVPHALYIIEGIVISSPDVHPVHLQQLAAVKEPLPQQGSIPAGSRLLKILCFASADNKSLETRLRALAAESGLDSTRTSQHFLEFLAADHHKDAAMDCIICDHDWPSFHTVSLGDGENDLPLLRRAGFSVAVGNSAAPVRAICDRVAPTCEEDGVAAFVHSLLEASP